MLFLYNDIVHRFELLVPRSHPFVTPWHFPCQGNLCLRRQQKRSHDVRSFCFCRHLCTVLSPATSHRSNVMRLLSVADKTIRWIVLSWRYNEATAVADNIFKVTGSSCSYLAVTLLSLHDISLSGEALFEAPTKKSIFDTISKLLFFAFIPHPLSPKSLICVHFWQHSHDYWINTLDRDLFYRGFYSLLDYILHL